MYVRKRGNKTSFSLQVIGIEVTRPIWKLDDYGVYETYYRTIRFKLHGGKVLEVHCSGAVEEYLKLRSVKTLKKLKTIEKRKPWNSGTPANGDWLTPVVYKGRSTEVTNPEPEDPGPPPTFGWLKPTLFTGYTPAEPSLIAKMVSGIKRLFR
jgi:hypothetical protein